MLGGKMLNYFKKKKWFCCDGSDLEEDDGTMDLGILWWKNNVMKNLNVGLRDEGDDGDERERIWKNKIGEKLEP